MTKPALNLWQGKTVHVRHMPFTRRFVYDLVLIDIDIDRLGEAASVSPLFSVNKPALFSFYEHDHGLKQKGQSLRVWAENILSKAGVQLNGGAIRLVTFPRHFFYKFAPLSLWYAYGPEGDLRGIIYEVNNTFGESHCYVAAVRDGRNLHRADKTREVPAYGEYFSDTTGSNHFKSCSLLADKPAFHDWGDDGNSLASGKAFAQGCPLSPQTSSHCS